MGTAFFEPDGDGFVATSLTRGLWDERAQHGGPPAALLARSVEVRLPEQFRLTRIGIDFLHPVPIGPVRPRVDLKLGGLVARARVVLESDGVDVIAGTATAQRVADLDLSSQTTTIPSLPAPDAGQPPVPYFSVTWEDGYHTAMSWRFVRGAWNEVGDAQLWMMQQVPLVAGEEPTAAQRAILVADAGNGASAAVDLDRFSFVNSDLVVHLHRQPVGEWIGMDARTVVQPTGAGLTTTVLHDGKGPVGCGVQSLVIQPQRSPSGATHH